MWLRGLISNEAIHTVICRGRNPDRFITAYVHVTQVVCQRLDLIRREIGVILNIFKMNTI